MDATASHPLDLHYSKLHFMLESANLYNIHVHSKLFKKIQIKGRIGKIIQQIHVGKKTLMHLNADSNSFWRLVLRVAGVQK